MLRDNFSVVADGVNLKHALCEIETDNSNILMHGNAPYTWLNGQIIARCAGAGAVHSIRSLREMGFDERAIADALGQKTIEMARHYSRDADLKRKIAGMDAVLEAEVNSRRTKTVKPGPKKLSNLE